MGALLLRLATAGSALAMTLALARMLGPAQFGLFAAMLSLATLAGVAATLGQNTAIQRLGDPARAPRRVRAATIRATGTVMTAALVTSGTGLAGAAAAGAAGQTTAAAIMAGAALLALPLALAEPALAAAQMRGRLWLALAPRDILWRLGLAAAALAASWPGNALAVAAAAALWLTLCVAAQMVLTGAGPPLALLRPRWRPDDAAFGRAAAAFSGIAAPSLTILVLTAMLGPAASGGFFAAQRIAQIAALPVHASRTAHLAALAAAFAADDRAALNGALARIRRRSVLPSLGLGLAAVVLGDPLLGLFGTGSPTMRVTLAILVTTGVAQALCGPTSLLMMLTGGHRALLRQTILFEGLALALVPVGVTLAGAPGAAIALAGGAVGGQLAAIRWLRRHLGVDPGIGAAILPPPDRRGSWAVMRPSNAGAAVRAA